MDLQTSKSLRERERKVLGNYSFTEPIVFQQGGQTRTRLVDRETPWRKRRNQVLQAQRSHRKRTQDYMTALESEVQRLRQISSDWERCSLALAGPLKSVFKPDHWTAHIGPGVFTWKVTGVLAEDVELFTKKLSWLLPLQAIEHFAYTSVPSSIEICDTSTRELLLNFYQKIAPTLDATELNGNGYAKHIIPLALESDLIRNALLAASASQVELTGRAVKGMALNYRSAAISGLHKASKQLRTDDHSALLSLAAILGLLIDDMINGNKDFPALVKLADSWVTANPVNNNRSHEQFRKFLIDQIQMLKSLVYPLYKFSQFYSPGQKTFTSNTFSTPVLSPLTISDIFTNLQNAMSQACFIYSSWPTSHPLKRTPVQGVSSNELDTLLDNLQLTVTDIPPFTPGEDTLVWVHSVAVSRSTSPKHRAFFSSRLAELLARVGHQDISGYLASVSVFPNYQRE